MIIQKYLFYTLYHFVQIPLSGECVEPCILGDFFLVVIFLYPIGFLQVVCGDLIILVCKSHFLFSSIQNFFPRSIGSKRDCFPVSCICLYTMAALLKNKTLAQPTFRAGPSFLFLKVKLFPIFYILFYIYGQDFLTFFFCLGSQATASFVYIIEPDPQPREFKR